MLGRPRSCWARKRQAYGTETFSRWLPAIDFIDVNLSLSMVLIYAPPISVTSYSCITVLSGGGMQKRLEVHSCCHDETHQTAIKIKNASLRLSCPCRLSVGRRTWIRVCASSARHGLTRSRASHDIDPTATGQSIHVVIFRPWCQSHKKQPVSTPRIHVCNVFLHWVANVPRPYHDVPTHQQSARRSPQCVSDCSLGLWNGTAKCNGAPPMHLVRALPSFWDPVPSEVPGFCGFFKSLALIVSEMQHGPTRTQAKKSHVTAAPKRFTLITRYHACCLHEGICLHVRENAQLHEVPAMRVQLPDGVPLMTARWPDDKHGV